MNLQELLSFLPIIAVFGFFYFFVIRPQSKQQKKIQSMRNELRKGDKIVTIGGFYGKIIAFKDDVLTVELKPDNIKVQITRAAVADVLNKTEEDIDRSE
ncbi:preprotein translocase subunit YajC [Alkalibacter saccharofermentans]|uniref:Preprotein translocase subunit YajC n=1 Tax=Alkalibacter saccharofermentans DSM 14828 TaxID=1120975 RepID=A0A1M4S4B8_9FIRM|nr:preprotein translocase subunit YajC [Alkalibacter saccharofermentans]SHE27019.1 preprotein translocase subunit YajC [Alkalibacter saccharofermentans DSM 14828]